MLELFGSLEESFQDYLMRDKYGKKIKGDDVHLLYEMAYRNANKAIAIIQSQGFVLADLRTFVSERCDLQYEERNDVRAYSSIRFPGGTITIYNKRIEEVMQEHGVALVAKDRFINLFILHEFYHYLEETMKDVFEDYRIPIFGLKTFNINSTVPAISEMSATAFMRLLVKDVQLYIEGGFHE